jgi:hypothetical protein
MFIKELNYIQYRTYVQYRYYKYQESVENLVETQTRIRLASHLIRVPPDLQDTSSESTVGRELGALTQLKCKDPEVQVFLQTLTEKIRKEHAIVIYKMVHLLYSTSKKFARV